MATMKPTVYIETTITGHLTSRLPSDPIIAGQMLETRRWWKESRIHFEIFTSEAVLLEASRGDPTAAAERLEAIELLPLIPITDGARALADFLVKRNALPSKARVDALHLATAAANGLQFLLTWNCRHLANATLQTKIQGVCRDWGFEPPIICTPFELNKVQR
jgi:predicted nucleic acid-binding protein